MPALGVVQELEFRGVLFDLGGTLIKTLEVPEIFRRILEFYGIRASREKILEAHKANEKELDVDAGQAQSGMAFWHSWNLAIVKKLGVERDAELLARRITERALNNLFSFFVLALQELERQSTIYRASLTKHQTYNSESALGWPRVQTQMSNKRNVVLYLDKELVEKTRELGFNLSKTFENTLKQLVNTYSNVNSLNNNENSNIQGCWWARPDARAQEHASFLGVLLLSLQAI